MTRLEVLSCGNGRTRLEVSRLELHRSTLLVARGERSVTIPAEAPQLWSVNARFKPFRADECDDFFEIDVIIDGVQRTMTLPLRVDREEE